MTSQKITREKYEIQGRVDERFQKYAADCHLRTCPIMQIKLSQMMILLNNALLRRHTIVRTVHYFCPCVYEL